ncbi:MAG: molecular chaperone DnaJ, partial [Planctomycetota bacterium]
DALRAFMRDFGGGSIFDDLFGMGGGSHRRRANRGEDLRIRVNLTLEEIAEGIEKTISVKRQVTCDVCDGTGVAAGSSRKTCPQCKGAGQVRRVMRTFLGTVQQVGTCDMCRGTGEIISDPCRSCGGQGRKAGTSKVNIKVPPGVNGGNYMTIEGMGNAATNNGEPGDLIVVFEELEHDIFTRHGDNIIYETPISFVTAALGGEIEVPSLNGTTTVKIPPGTQSGKIIKLRGRGIPHLNRHGRGDQLVHLTVWVPTRLTAEEKRILEKLRDSESFSAPKSDKSFFARLRESLGV